VELSKYRFMWLITLFDLPVDTPKARRAYAQFRKHLLKDGFTKMQYSVYIRHCPSQESVDVHVARVQRCLPPDGEVRILVITEKQYERMRVFWGKRRKPPETPPAQLEFF